LTYCCVAPLELILVTMLFRRVATVIIV